MSEESPTCAHGTRFPAKWRPKPERQASGSGFHLKPKEKRYAELFMASGYWSGGAGDDVPSGNARETLSQSRTERSADRLRFQGKARAHWTRHSSVPAV